MIITTKTGHLSIGNLTVQMVITNGLVTTVEFNNRDRVSDFIRDWMLPHIEDTDANRGLLAYLGVELPETVYYCESAGFTKSELIDTVNEMTGREDDDQITDLTVEQINGLIDNYNENLDMDEDGRLTMWEEYIVDTFGEDE